MIERMAVLLQLPLTGQGPGYTCGMLAREMATQGLAITIVTPRTRAFGVSPAVVIESLPRWARYVPHRILESRSERMNEAAFLEFATNPLSQIQAAYLFPDATVQTIRQLKQANIIVFREMINCHRGTAKTILDDAYRRIGVVPRHGISGASVVEEQQALEEVDCIICPSPMVEASLLENGIPARKLLRASYGWDPGRLSAFKKQLKPIDGVTVLFVGSICVRKGVHLLLDYWARSGVKGRLVLAGRMEEVIKKKCARLLNRDDIVVLDYVADVGSLYRSADIFILPTLEEGSPLVTYEACACGLPSITTPMGAGDIIRDNREGFVIDPYDEIRCISAIRALAEDVERRRTMGAAAVERAGDFVWSEVAFRRRQQILGRLVPPLEQ
jgi:glycosyltransferase involved in cell wall biosynthesis